MGSLANQRRCKVCGRKKSLDEFLPGAWEPINKNSAVETRTCLECLTAIEAMVLPEEINEKQLKTKSLNLMRSYGINLKEYERLYARQNGLCAICHEPEKGKTRLFLAVDHSHDTGQVRGLLCSRCNTALGLFNDSITNLMAAVWYLRKNSQRQAYESRDPSEGEVA